MTDRLVKPLKNPRLPSRPASVAVTDQTAEFAQLQQALHADT